MATMDYVLGQLKRAKEEVFSSPNVANMILDQLVLLFHENKDWFSKQVDHTEPDQRDKQLGNVRMQLDAVMGERDTLRRKLSDMRATLAEVAEEGAKAQQKSEQMSHVGQPLTEFLSHRYHGHPRFFELIERMVVIHEAKNRDYAGGDDWFRNFTACEVWNGDPFIGIMHKLTDKWSRVCTLVREDRIDDPAVTDETIENTFIDGANFFLIAQIMLERRRAQEEAEERWLKNS